MQYKVRLLKSEEGYAICYLSLPGCWSQRNCFAYTFYLDITVSKASMIS